MFEWLNGLSFQEVGQFILLLRKKALITKVRLLHPQSQLSQIIPQHPSTTHLIAEVYFWQRKPQCFSAVPLEGDTPMSKLKFFFEGHLRKLNSFQSYANTWCCSMGCAFRQITGLLNYYSCTPWDALGIRSSHNFLGVGNLQTARGKSETKCSSICETLRKGSFPGQFVFTCRVCLSCTVKVFLAF